MNRLKKLAAALPFLVSSLAFAGDLDDAKALQAAGRFEEALPKFQAAAQADPANAGAALGLSQVLAGLGRYDEAARAVDAARKANPGDASLLAAKGRAYLLAVIKEESAEEPDAGRIEGYKSDAARWTGEALKADAKNVDALLLRGQLRQRDGDAEKAFSDFEQAAAADPKSFDAAYEVANHWFQKANADRKSMELWAKAEAAFATAAALDPKSLLAALNLAGCKGWQGKNPKEVSAAFVKALELSPADESILSKVYNWTPQEDRAEICQSLVDASPKDVTRKRYLAYALMSPPWRNFQKALDVLEEAAKLDPSDPFVPLNEGDVKLAWGKHEDAAVDNYVEAMTLFKGKGGIDDASYIRLAGPVAYQSQSLSEEQREKLWTSLSKLFPDRSDAMNNAGLWFRDVGKDYKKSLEWYLRAAKAAPDDCCIQNDTGLIYHYHMNDFEKAEPYYRRAVEIGNAQGLDCTIAGKDPDRGFHDAINNMYKILSAKKRWKDLKEFAQNDVPESHPLRELWIGEAGKKQGKQ